MKKIIALVLALVMCLSLCACGGKAKETTPEFVQNILAADIDETIVFGTYEQDNIVENGAEPIEWIVVAREEDRVLLISKYCIDAKHYYDEAGGTTWKGSSVRSWLNGAFINDAFSEDEQKFLVPTTIINEDNGDYGTNGGGDTTDRVFLLSIDEAYDYFPSDESRIGSFTPYAEEKAHWTFFMGTEMDTSLAVWWLRSPGEKSNKAATITRSGSVNSAGNYMDEPAEFVDMFKITTAYIYYAGIRPAIWVGITENGVE